MRVLGIDPGYAIVGWGVLDYAGNRFAPVDFGAVCTDAGVPFEQRLDEVYTGIREVIERTQPEVLAIEKLFYQHNQTTVIGVAEARGVILLAAAAISGVLAVLENDSFADVIIILAVVLINAVLGVYQESKAEKAIEALQDMAAATSKVVRDGKMSSILSKDLVVGDIICLEAGDAVPADARILESASLKAEEAALTGESVPVTKLIDQIFLADGERDVPLGDRKNMVYMGSTIVYGRAVAVVTATGMDTERGVYVISVNALGSVLRDYIRPNDVILELGGKTVNNLADLQKAVQETDLKQPQTMVIFRSQKENKLTLPGNLLK